MACAAVVAVAVAGAACGAGERGSGGSGSEGSAQAVAAAKAALAPVEKPVDAWTGPADSPPAVKGKKVWIISCAQASNCSIDTGGVDEAAKVMGWTTTIFDGQGDPARYNQGIRNAVAAGASGIVLVSIPTGLVQDGLRFAKNHGIPVVNTASQDTKDTQTDPLVFANVVHPWAAQGTWLGQWMVADSNGSANVVIIRDDEFSGVKLRQDKVVEELRKCPGCKVLNQVQATIGDATSSRMTQITQSQIDRFGPKLKYIVSPFGTVESFIVPALKGAGRNDIKIVGYDGNRQQSSFCAQGSVGAIATTLLVWTGWAGVDQMNRAFNGKPAVEENVKGFLATHDNKTCPDNRLTESQVTFDFKSKFKQLWHVG